LWYYFIDALIQFKTTETVSFRFPDQALLVKIEKKSADYIRLTINNKITNINYSDFIIAMHKAAKLFFDNLVILFPKRESYIQDSLGKVTELKYLYNL
jgi:hypothetical protein